MESFNLDQAIGHAYCTRDFSVMDDCQLLDAICRIETLGDNMPASMLTLFEAEADERDLRGDLSDLVVELTPAELKSALKLIWRHAPADYKSTYGGVKSILVLRQSGTTLVPLDQLTEHEIVSRLPAAQSKEAKRLAAKGGAV